jgi:ferredoxin-NADP reductase
MELTVPHRTADLKGIRRVFSISSAPGEDAPLTFALKVEGDSVSSFKRALLDLAPGATVRGTLVAGDFMLPTSLETPILLVAGGIGITPFASQIADNHARGLDRDVVVAYAVNDPSELAYSDLLKKSGARVIVTAPSKPPRLPAGWVYAGTRLTREVIEQHVPDAAARHTYISGPPSLVNALRVTLRRLGARRITTDYFSGY